MKIKFFTISTLLFLALAGGQIIAQINYRGSVQAEIVWQSEVKDVWQTLMAVRKRKYLLVVVQGNANVLEINKLDKQINDLETSLDKLIEVGCQNSYRV